ncbi:proteasome complex subunit Rpn13 ubiquitin receptor-domain-containing protein [Choanephora cucurbitarum]|nr:proteasome complex subunit Rpn13 ubiquitin receptor-domain-containing protein [Choanephora cucurbitarum]
MSLFPTPQRNNHLVEFNAGKVIREGNLLKPDLRKGVIYMDQSDDQLMHFYWKERKFSEPQDDFIIFPDEAELTRVSQCTTGRVYCLQFKSSSQKVFYWMQSKNAEKDEELVARVNQLINDPQSAANEDGYATRHGDEDDDDLDMNITQDNLLQFIQNAGGLGLSSTLPTHTEDQADQQISWANVQLELVQVEPPSEPVSLELDDVLTVNHVRTLLNDQDIQPALFPFVSQNTDRSDEDVRQLIQSQPFQQRLQVLHVALQQDRLTEIVSQLGIEKNVKAFLKAAEEHARRKSANQDVTMDE